MTRIRQYLRFKIQNSKIFWAALDLALPPFASPESATASYAHVITNA